MWWQAAAKVGQAFVQGQVNKASARNTEKLLNKQADSILKQADSLLYADRLNRTSKSIESEEVKSQQVTAFASSGVDISSGSVNSAINDTEANSLKNKFLMKMDADLRAETLREEALNLREQGAQGVRNAKRAAFFGIVNAGVNAAASSGGAS